MRREICVVISVQEKCFTLKNIRNEFYELDKSLLDGFEIGDKLIISYYGRNMIDKNIYNAEIKSIFRFDSTLHFPAR